MRRANGTGSIVKLLGNRRRPYLVKIAIRDAWGRVKQVPLSYHSKIAEAQEALDAYNRNKAAGLAPRADKFSTTLGDVYALWSPRKFAQVSPLRQPVPIRAAGCGYPGTKTCGSRILPLMICRPSLMRMPPTTSRSPV